MIEDCRIKGKDTDYGIVLTDNEKWWAVVWTNSGLRLVHVAVGLLFFGKMQVDGSGADASVMGPNFLQFSI